MLINSSLLIWAIIQVVISGSQTMPQTTPSEVTECPPPWFSIGNQCFRVVTENMLNWATARTHCKAQAPCGVDLAQPNDIKALADYINDNGYPNGYNDGYWLGGSDLTTEGEWLWVNNSTITATGWGHRQPNDDYSCEDCLAMRPGWGAANSLNDEGCGTFRHFICERHLCPTPVEDCPSPWFRVGNECFLRVGWSEVLMGLNWIWARSYCDAQAVGSDLAQPNDIKALADYLVDSGNYPYSRGLFWIGASDVTNEGEWLWLNGSVVTNTTHYRGFERNKGDCLTMYLDKGLDLVELYDRRCDSGFVFICERH